MRGDREKAAGSYLAVDWSVARTPLLALLLLGASLVACEYAVRLPSLRALLIPASVGAATRQLDLQIAGLSAQSARGELDCVIIGSSLVSSGIDPAVIEAAYGQQTGRPLRCFAFGIPLLMAEGASALSRILLEDHQPKMLVYGYSARAFRRSSSDDRKDPSMAVPWVQHRLGALSLEGWLVEHSAAYRQFLSYRPWLDEESWNVMRYEDRKPNLAGFIPNSRIFKNDDLEADPGSQDGPDTDEAAPWHADFGPLEELAALRTDRVELVLLEMPVHATMLSRFPALAEDHARVRAAMSDFAKAEAIPFFQPGSSFLPDQGWHDIAHLNTTGAAALSAWLGEQLARDPRLRQVGPQGQAAE